MKPISFHDARLSIDENKIIELMLNDPAASRNDIADEMDTSPARVSKLLRSAREICDCVPEFRIGHRGPMSDYSPAQIRELVKQLGRHGVAERFGVSPSAVSHRCKADFVK